MPLIVDHDERRRQIAAIVARLVGEFGLERITLRDVAREAGYSTAIVSHYFDSKLDMLVFTRAEVRRRASERVARALESGESLLSCFEQLLPIDAERLSEWRTWMAYWGKANVDPTIASERLNGVIDSHELQRQVLERARERGELPANADCAYLSTRMQIFLDGVAALVTQDPASWPPSRQRAFLAAELRAMHSVPTLDETTAAAAVKAAAASRGGL